ncbi:MAG: phosphoribosylglycinamide formyltransferase [Alphaproteobacteria bacterium]
MRTAIFISGRGSNMRALIDAAATDDFPAEIALVISNTPDAAGLEYAAEWDIPTRVLNHRDFDERGDFDNALHDIVAAAGIELICLAGFMRLLGEEFIQKWPDRIINIHPSLLPAFRGLNTHERVLSTGVRFTGCTVHLVRPEMDDGPIIGQAVVPVQPDDGPEDLAERVLAAEHRLYPYCLWLVASGRTRVQGATVVLENTQTPDTVLLNPLPDR